MEHHCLEDLIEFGQHKGFKKKELLKVSITYLFDYYKNTPLDKHNDIEGEKYVMDRLVDYINSNL